MQQAARDGGFSMVELLVVVLILGVLAAIAIPTFLSTRDDAHRAQVESDVRSVAIALRTIDGLADGLPDEDDVDFTDDEAPSEDPLVLPVSQGTVDDDGDTGLEYVLDGDEFCLAGWHSQVSGEEPLAQWESSQGGLVADPESCDP